MKPCPHPVERLLPQAHPMILIDEIVGCEPARVCAGVAVRSGAPFFQEGCGIAAHIAIEWMAQTCAALIGIESLEAGRPVGLGLLLGTRNFKATVPWFRVAERFIVTGCIAYRDQQMAVFDCTVVRDPGAEEVAAAQLTTYQPEDLPALMKMGERDPGKAEPGP